MKALVLIALIVAAVSAQGYGEDYFAYEQPPPSSYFQPLPMAPPAPAFYPQMGAVDAYGNMMPQPEQEEEGEEEEGEEEQEQAVDEAEEGEEEQEGEQEGEEVEEGQEEEQPEAEQGQEEYEVAEPQFKQGRKRRGIGRWMRKMGKKIGRAGKKAAKAIWRAGKKALKKWWKSLGRRPGQPLPPAPGQPQPPAPGQPPKPPAPAPGQPAPKPAGPAPALPAPKPPVKAAAPPAKPAKPARKYKWVKPKPVNNATPRQPKAKIPKAAGKKPKPLPAPLPKKKKLDCKKFPRLCIDAETPAEGETPGDRSPRAIFKKKMEVIKKALMMNNRGIAAEMKWIKQVEKIMASYSKKVIKVKEHIADERKAIKELLRQRRLLLNDKKQKELEAKLKMATTELMSLTDALKQVQKKETDLGKGKVTIAEKIKLLQEDLRQLQGSKKKDEAKALKKKF